MHRPPFTLWQVSAAISACLVAPAQAQVAAGLPLWELGAVGVGVSQPAYPGAAERTQQALVLPYLVYRGEFLRVDRGSAGIRAMKTPTFEVDIGFSGSLGSKASETEVRRGMADLGTLVEFGPRLKWNLTPDAGPSRWQVELPLRGAFDLSNNLTQRGLTLEPEISFSHREPQGWSYSTSLSALLGDQRLADTFYGVSASEATASRPVYAAQGGLIAWRLSGTVSRRLGPDVRLIAFGRADSLAGAANQNSPLVQRNSGLNVGLVLAYTWKQSESRAAD
jgi:outer membrane scaffolding protein for murein synthesis (MipA/OmpV family)